jgi:hypothetical protein
MDKTIIRFPPHLGAVLVQTVSPNDLVKVEGALETPGTVHASSIIDLQKNRSIADTPPFPTHPPPNRPRGDRRQMSASGPIRVLIYSQRGEVSGAVLADGVIVHLPPLAKSDFSALFQEGQTLAATGYGTINAYGKSFEADKIGRTLDHLQCVD